MDHEAIAKEVTFTAIRGRGPGGQNVNKVSSAAHMLWAFLDSNTLTQEQKDLIRSKLANSINKDNLLYIRSDEFRDLERNKERCLKKLEIMLKSAFHRPKPRTKTKPTYASVVKKKESKTRRSQVKKLRTKVSY
ncbi:MAG: aminoacyl-tRNA hydrolase [Bdellovibrio sp.]|nr:aminoacyl-tRNA hydrolase [Bdellovibrio sp.]